MQHHPHHAAAIASFVPVVSGKHEGCVSTHGLAETYSTLTKLPLSPMIHPSEAFRFLDETVLRHCHAVALRLADYREVLHQASAAGWRGGIVYDALHIRCAENYGCDRIYTFNLGHFLKLAPQLKTRVASP